MGNVTPDPDFARCRNKKRSGMMQYLFKNCSCRKQLKKLRIFSPGKIFEKNKCSGVEKSYRYATVKAA